MAEREGFEPPIPVKVCLISSQVHSTALPSLRVFVFSYLRYHFSTCSVHCDVNCLVAHANEKFVPAARKEEDPHTHTRWSLKSFTPFGDEIEQRCTSREGLL